MPEEVKKEWIVLINRAPKGPLVLEEIQALIEEGIIRRNDLACYVFRDKSQKSDWKFLWQFPEFDRRTDKISENPQTASTTPSVVSPLAERRETLHEEELKFKAKSLLPEEIESIRAEDLILHSTTLSKHKEGEDIDLSEEDIRLPEQTRSRPVLTYIASATALVLVFLFIRSHKTDTNKPVAAVPQKNMVLPLETLDDSALRAPTADPVKKQAVVQAKPQKIEVPKAPPENKDHGDIAYEEYRKKRDAELEKERQREDEERNPSSEEENSTDEDKPKMVKKKNKKSSDDEEIKKEDSESNNPTSEDPEEEKSSDE